MTLRKLNLKVLTSFLLAAIAVTMFYSCSEDDGQDSNSARLIVHMTDGPGDYDHVYVDVQDVRIKADASTNDDEGWVSLENVQKGEYDLLSLTNGVTQLLADSEVPVGNLGQIRLVLGPDNFVVLNDGIDDNVDVRIPLNTPSAQQSGLKLNVNQQMEAGELYEYLLDFDVDQSIVNTGNGGYILKPVIRLSTVEGSGRIEGTVLPTVGASGDNFQIKVTATNANHTISAYTNASGGFVLHNVPAGTYRVKFMPEETSGYAELEKINIQVSSGGVVELGTVDLLEL